MESLTDAGGEGRASLEDEIIGQVGLKLLLVQSGGMEKKSTGTSTRYCQGYAV